MSGSNLGLCLLCFGYPTLKTQTPSHTPNHPVFQWRELWSSHNTQKEMHFNYKNTFQSCLLQLEWYPPIASNYFLHKISHFKFTLIDGFVSKIQLFCFNGLNGHLWKMTCENHVNQNIQTFPLSIWWVSMINCQI